MLLAANGDGLTDLTGGQLGIVGAIAPLSVAALLVAYVFVREVLAADVIEQSRAPSSSPAAAWR